MNRAFVPALLALSACGAGKYQGPLMDRPPTLQAGLHQFQVGAGGGKGGAFIGPFVYRYGITDALDYVFPLAVGYGFTWEKTTLTLSGGLFGLGFRSCGDSARSEDPRVRASYAPGSCIITSFGGQAKVGHRLESALLVGGLGGTSILVGDVADSSRLSAEGAVVFQPSESVSVTFSANVGRTWEWHRFDFRDEVFETFIGVGGYASSGVVSLPLLSWHAFEELDFFGTVGATYVLTDGRSVVYGGLGVDWHFD